VLLAREAAGTDYVETWTTSDSGATWTSTQLATAVAASDTTLTRAFPVHAVDGGTPIFAAMAAEIDSYPNYNGAWKSRFRPLPRTTVAGRLADIDTTATVTDPTLGVRLDGTAGRWVLGEDVDPPSLGVRLEVDCALDDWSNGAVQNLLAKESSASTRTVRLALGSDGKLQLIWSADGTTPITVASTSAVPFADGQRGQVRVDFVPAEDATHYRIVFFTRYNSSQRWTQVDLFETAASATSMFASASPWEVGSRRLGTTELAKGTFYRASVMTRGGTVLTEWRGDGPAIYRDSAGHVWTQIRSDLTATLRMLDSGEATLPRISGGNALVAWTSGSLRLAYFTARKTEMISQIYAVAAAGAGATPTLCRMAWFSVAANGDLTLIGACANDTTLFASATKFTRSLTGGPFLKVAGTVYALGILVVTGASMPTFAGASVSSADSRDEPVLTGALGSQTDITSPIAVGSLTVSGSMPRIGLLP
jgi:hypothetical protein